MPKRRSQSEHDSMIEFLADSLYGRNLADVRADIPGYKRPDVIIWPGCDKGHVPDVTAYEDTRLFIYEVETADSINDPHTEEQWKLFTEYAKQHNAIFHVAVPPMELQTAKKRLKELNLEAKAAPIP